MVLNPLASARALAGGLVTGIPANMAFNAVSKRLTGKTTEELAQPYTGNELSYLGNPGNYAGAKVAHNAKNFGRFVMDNVYPANYKGHGMEFAKAILKTLNPFSKIPHFYNGKKPKWYNNPRHNIYGDRDIRLENMAEWVGVPEKEIPRRIIYRNADGTYGLKETMKSPPILPDVEEAMKNKNKMVKEEDLVFGVGGLHSDFTLKDIQP